VHRASENAAAVRPDHDATDIDVHRHQVDVRRAIVAMEELTE
jgi:hypothetical protein